MRQKERRGLGGERAERGRKKGVDWGERGSQEEPPHRRARKVFVNTAKPVRLGMKNMKVPQ